MKIWTFAVTLALNTTIQFLHDTFQNKMMYHSIKFGSKKSRPVEQIWKKQSYLIMSRHCDLDLEDSKPILTHDTLAHSDVSPCQVWLQNIKQLGRYSHMVRWKFDQVWTFAVTLALSRTQQYNLFTRTTKLLMMCHQTKVGCKRISSSKNMAEN